MTMTPYEIEVLLHHHCSVAPFARGGYPIYEETVSKFSEMGLLHEADGTFRTTEKGEALVAMLCATPMPVSGGWIDPRLVNEQR